MANFSSTAANSSGLILSSMIASGFLRNLPEGRSESTNFSTIHKDRRGGPPARQDHGRHGDRRRDTRGVEQRKRIAMYEGCEPGYIHMGDAHQGTGAGDTWENSSSQGEAKRLDLGAMRSEEDRGVRTSQPGEAAQGRAIARTGTD